MARQNWARYQMPEDMAGRSFLDVGCWEGDNCVAALERGAAAAVGLDLCTSTRLRDNVERHGVQFLQMDVLSEKFWELPDFDVVLCSGVLYHVEHPLSLLFRLRKVTRELLFLESAIHPGDESQPLLRFLPGRELNSNPSNWWLPNRRCLFAMLETVGFRDVEQVWDRDDGEVERLAVRAVPSASLDLQKVLPRKVSKMSLYGGDRGARQRHAEEQSAEQAPAVETETAARPRRFGWLRR